MSRSWLAMKMLWIWLMMWIRVTLRSEGVLMRRSRKGRPSLESQRSRSVRFDWIRLQLVSVVVTWAAVMGAIKVDVLANRLLASVSASPSLMLIVRIMKMLVAKGSGRKSQSVMRGIQSWPSPSTMSIIVRTRQSGEALQPQPWWNRWILIHRTNSNWKKPINNKIKRSTD